MDELLHSSSIKLHQYRRSLDIYSHSGVFGMMIRSNTVFDPIGSPYLSADPLPYPRVSCHEIVSSFLTFAPKDLRVYLEYHTPPRPTTTPAPTPRQPSPSPATALLTLRCPDIPTLPTLHALPTLPRLHCPVAVRPPLPRAPPLLTHYNSHYSRHRAAPRQPSPRPTTTAHHSNNPCSAQTKPAPPLPSPHPTTIPCSSVPSPRFTVMHRTAAEWQQFGTRPNSRWRNVRAH